MKKTAFKIVLNVFFSAYMIFTPQWSLAAGLVPCGGDGEKVCELCDLLVGFHNLTTYLLEILITITLAGLFFSGVMYIISAGDSGMMQTAKGFAGACLKGFVIVLGAWLIVNVTMWVVSANFSSNTGIGQANWFEFTCIREDI